MRNQTDNKYYLDVLNNTGVIPLNYTGRVNKKLIPLAGCGIDSVWSIIKAKMLIYQSKANLYVM